MFERENCFGSAYRFGQSRNRAPINHAVGELMLVAVGCCKQSAGASGMESEMIRERLVSEVRINWNYQLKSVKRTSAVNMGLHQTGFWFNDSRKYTAKLGQTGNL